jgi:hypothetical protein
LVIHLAAERLTSITRNEKIGKQRFDVKMVHVLTALVEDLKKSPLVRASTPSVDWDPYPMNNLEPEPQLTQDYLWPVGITHPIEARSKLLLKHN